MNHQLPPCSVGLRQSRRIFLVVGLLVWAIVAVGNDLHGAEPKRAKAVYDALAKVRSERDVLRRRMSANRLKMIALAFNKFHKQHGHYPPAVFFGPDGQTAHNWRVAILPALGEQPLYDMYKLDEPWDSENNKKVLAKIPEPFRDPLADKGAVNTAYFAITGKGTAFENPIGLTSAQRDAESSNTIMIVETKREIPWTKPEDIAYDSHEAPPKLGGCFAGGFHALLCDGTVRFIPDKIDQESLRHLMEFADGHAVTIPKFDEPQANVGSEKKTTPDTEKSRKSEQTERRAKSDLQRAKAAEKRKARKAHTPNVD